MYQNDRDRSVFVSMRRCARSSLLALLCLTAALVGCSDEGGNAIGNGGSTGGVDTDGLTLGDASGRGGDISADVATVAATSAIAIATPWPDRGPVGGDAIVILTGAGFGPEARVLFGAAEATVLHRDAGERIIVHTPAGDAGAVDVIVRNADGGEARAEGAYTYIVPTAKAPKLSSLSPSSGPSIGGTVAQVKGSEFSSGATFLLGWQVLGGSTVVDAKTAQIVTPTLGLGAHPLAIIHTDGQSALLDDAFTAVDAADLGPKPSLGTLLPAASDVAGGASVAVTGTGFGEDATLTIGGQVISSWQRTDAGSGSFVAPPHAAGLFDVALTNADGQSAMLANGFLYFTAPPVIFAVVPASGPVQGGAAVTLVGERFVAGAKVSVGGKPCAEPAVGDGGTKIVCTLAAPDKEGPADVLVTNPDGISGKLPGGYSFVGPQPNPSVSGATPSSAGKEGGTLIVVKGAELRADSMARFGAKVADQVLARSATELVVALPAADAAGKVDLAIVTPNLPDAVLKGGFTYTEQGPPQLSEVVPGQGPVTGGIVVVLKGKNLRPESVAYFGDAKAETAWMSGADGLAVVLPKGKAGTVDVVVKTPSLPDAKLAGAFVYKDDSNGQEVVPPAVAKVTPAQAPLDGGGWVLVHGASFPPDAKVRFGGKAAAEVIFLAAGELVARVPAAAAAGAVDVVVEDPATLASGKLSGGFAYVDASSLSAKAPTIASIKPALGPSAGGTLARLDGAELQAGALVFVAGRPATTVRFVDGGLLSFRTPAGKPGAVDVVLVNPDGQHATLTGGFVYTGGGSTGLALSGAKPVQGSAAGGTTVSLSGKGFAPGLLAFVDGVPVTPTLEGPTALTLLTPAHDPGLVDLAVTSSDGFTATLGDAFNFVLEAPYVASVAPSWGIPAGGTKVTIVGQGFHPKAKVRFGDAEANVISAASTAIVAVVPASKAGALGAVAVTVTNPDFLTHTLKDGFLYSATEPGLQVGVGAVLPVNADKSGGSKHVLHGSGFGPGASVILVSAGGGSALASDVAVLDAKTLTFTAPAGAVGPTELRVVMPGVGEGKRKAALFYFDPKGPHPFPTLTAVHPGVGPTTGGTIALLDAAPALAEAKVFVDGLPATLLGADGDAALVIETPAHAAGAVDVALMMPDGRAAVLSGGFAYWTPGADLTLPVLTGVEPSSGSTAGGSKVVLTGKGVVAGTIGFLGGRPLKGAAQGSATTLNGTSPAHPAGLVDAAFTRPDGLSASAKAAFSYVQPAPVPELAFPAIGHVDGGTLVVLSGQNFAPNAKVSFGGKASQTVKVVASHLLTAVVPPTAAGAGKVAIEVTNPDGQKGTLDGAFTYQDGAYTAKAPSLAKMVPSKGPWQGGTVAVLYGGELQPGAKVLVGGQPAKVHVVDAGFATITTPKGFLGPVDVVLLNPDGQAATLPAGFAYQSATLPAPQLLGITPSSGPEVGGTAVILTGASLTGGGVGLVGYRPLASWTVLNSAIATGTTVAGSAGKLDVCVTNGDGQSATLSAAFDMVGAPQIDGINPAIGAVSGGTLVTIAGKNFASGAEVRFGGKKATSVNVLSAFVIKAVTPPSAPGPAQVSVSNPDGQGTVGKAPFLYVLPPEIGSVFPTMGSAKGGTPVIVRGKNFLAGAKVLFGTKPASVVHFISESVLSVIAPAGTIGEAVSVTVDNPDGQSAIAAKAWLWLDAAKMAPPPDLAALTPTRGPQAGGTVGLAQGIGLTEGAQLIFGVTPAAETAVLGASMARFVTAPFEVTGTVDVVLVQADGNYTTLQKGFDVRDPGTLGPKPSIATVSPPTGPTKGGAIVSVAGADLDDGSLVFFGGLPATKVSKGKAGELVATTPAHALGPVKVIVTDTDGWSVEADAAYAFVPPPTLESIDPPAGPAAGGTFVTLKGGNFVVPAKAGAKGTRLMFCGNFASSTDCVEADAATVEVVDSNTLTAKTPAQVAGLSDVVVLNPDGQTAMLGAGYLFRPAPKVVAITPASGSTLGDDAVVITGSGFQKGAIVRFADLPASAVTFVDGTKLTAKTPKGSAGPVAVTVENPDGGKHVVGGGFLYIAPPSISNVFPGLGPESGGTVVTIQGAAFVQGAKGSKVYFGSNQVPDGDVQIESVGIIKAKTPKGTGPVAVKIVNPDGQIALMAGGFVYIPVIPAPKVSYVQPGFAATSGGVQISVYGEGFLTGATVSFGNDATGYVNATENSVLNGGTLVVCKAPAHLPGTVNVKVTNSDGQSGVLSNGFEFIAPLALPALAISGVTPDRGPVAGGYDVVIYGQGFKAGVEVSFGSATTATWVKAKTVVRLGPTLLRVEVPEAAKAGQVDVRIVNPVVGGMADEIVGKTLFTYGQSVILEPMAHRLPIDSTTGDGVPIVADFNGDGLNDVFVQRSTTDDLFIQVKDAKGEPGQFIDQSATLPKYSSYCTSSNAYGTGADIDGDGDVDILFRGQNYYLCILRNEGDGTFKSEYHGNQDLSYMRDFAVADVTCDGLIDIVVVGTQQNFVLVNNGKGGYVKDLKLIPAHKEPSTTVALGDVDNDGDVDMLVGNDSAVQNRLYYNSCNNVAQGQPGSFQDASYGNGKNFPVSGFNTRTVLLRDLDGDGWLDAFVFNWGQTDRIYLNKGGNFLADDGSRFPQEEALAHSSGAWARDVDGDGDIDLLVRKQQAVAGRYWVHLYLNEKSQTGQTKWTDATPSNMAPWRGEDSVYMDVGDLDGDKLPDIYVVKPYHQDWLLINHGYADGKAAIDANRVPKGSFSNNTFRGLPHDVAESSAADAGDIDGDGDIDIVIGNMATGGVSVWINDSAGNFFEQGETRVPDINCGAAELRLLDLNKDGDLDIMVACNYDWGGGTIGAVAAKTNAGGLRQLVNDGKGYFTDVSKDNLPYSYNNYRFYGLDLGDIDGDKDMDLVVGGYFYDPTEILIHGGDPFNNGGAYYFVKSNYLDVPQDYKYRTCFVLADLNNDKHPDLYLGKSSAQNVLYHNQGSGVMKDVSTSHLPSVSDNTTRVLAADVDKDGDVDLFVINDGENRLQISELDYKLADVTSSHLPGGMSANSRDGALVDLDGDGLLDLVTASWGSRNQLLLGEGDAHFKNLTASMPRDDDPTRRVIVADFDGDGRPDLFFASRDVNRIYLNKTPKVGGK